MSMNRHERRAAAKNLRAKGLGTEAGSLDQVVEAGIAAANGGQMAKAEEQFRAALKIEPTHIEARHQLGTLLARTGRGDEGIALLKEVTTALPNEALYWSNLAAACYSVHDTPGAVEAARQAVKLRPDYGMAWDNLGSALMDQQSYAEAIDALKRAIDLGAGDLASDKRLAACYLLRGDLQTAERNWRAIAAKHPQDIEAQANLGGVLADLGDLAGARTVLEAAVALSPDYFPSAYQFGRVLRRLGETEAALRWLRRATSAEPRNAVAWHNLAETLFEAGDKDNALVAVERAVTLNPSEPLIVDLATRIRGAKSDSDSIIIKPDESGVVDLSILKIGA